MLLSLMTSLDGLLVGVVVVLDKRTRSASSSLSAFPTCVTGVGNWVWPKKSMRCFHWVRALAFFCASGVFHLVIAGSMSTFQLAVFCCKQNDATAGLALMVL